MGLADDIREAIRASIFDTDPEDGGGTTVTFRRPRYQDEFEGWVDEQVIETRVLITSSTPHRPWTLHEVGLDNQMDFGLLSIDMDYATFEAWEGPWDGDVMEWRRWRYELTACVDHPVGDVITHHSAKLIRKNRIGAPGAQ